jgi:glutamine amidotransferase
MVAIIDYGLSNLFSVNKACARIGVDSAITSSRHEIMQSDAVILAGVGAFGEAMRSLKELDIVGVLRDYASSGRPFLGICLGMQLLMTASEEFGYHIGLDIVKGKVKKLADVGSDGSTIKVPHVGWSSVYPSLTGKCGPSYESAGSWSGTPLDGIPPGFKAYFSHSYFAEPNDPATAIAFTDYGNNTFCSGLRCSNVTAFQFHPECSGPYGMKIYENILLEFNTGKQKER